MRDDLVLARTPALPPAQDYAGLRAEGLRHVERLASARWTDYNAHDPGITVLEAACYALTELGHRIGLPVADLLASSGGGTVHSARDLLPTATVTFDDLRRRLVDVPGIADAFVEIHTATAYGLADGALTASGSAVPVGGLIDVSLVLEARVGEGAVERVGPRAPGRGSRARRVQAPGMTFDVVEPLVLESVTVFPELAPADDEVSDAAVTLRILAPGGDTLRTWTVDVGARTTRESEVVSRGVCVPLGVALEPGAGYVLQITAPPSVSLVRERGVRQPTTYGQALRIEVGPRPAANRAVRFAYDWHVRSQALTGATLDREAVLAEVQRRLDADRGLCQDVASVCVVEPEEVGLCAEIEVAPGADLAAVVAGIHHALARHVAPPVHFYSVDELVTRGHAMDAIFEGPRLDHGVLDPDEWAARRRRCRIQTSDLIGLVLAVEGVVAVRSASVLSYVDGAPRAEAPWVLDLVGGRTPVYRPERSSLALFERGLPSTPNPVAVAERLAALRRTDRPARLGTSAQDRPVPAGTAYDTADYWPLQNDLPPLYGVGQTPVRASASAARTAQAEQFKAYLLFFEQVLADAFAQLGTVGDLLSWATSDGPTLAVQPVGEVDGIDDLYARGAVFASGPGFDRAAELRAITEGPDAAVVRRLRLLEHLLARLGASLEAYEQVQPNDPETRRRVAEDKRRYLADAPALDAERGLGADLGDADALPGYARRVYALLGLRDARRRRLASERFAVVAEPDTRGGRDVAVLRFVAEDGGGTRLFEGPEIVVALDEALADVAADPNTDAGCLFATDGTPETWPLAGPARGEDAFALSEEAARAVERMLDLALSLGANAANYATDAGSTRLVQRCSDGTVDVLGAVAPGADPAAVRAAFAEAAVAPGDEGFHVVEHVLLRPRADGDPFLPLQTAPGCSRIVDPYSFRASVVLPAWPTRFRDLAFRRFVEQTIRAEAPAHVALRVCWVSHRQMRALEAALDAWQRALGATRRLGCPADDPAPRRAGCSGDASRRRAATAARPPLRPGTTPLPESAGADTARADALGALADVLFDLVTVFPAARLHDCTAAGRADDVRPVTLGATQLGSL